ncbi:MAG: ATP phosphoribosyltransferase regulatory subunit [Pseudomonadota bacterium]
MNMNADTSWPLQAHRALLPEGVADQIAPSARRESLLRQRLLGCFHMAGYQQVSPPMLEYIETLEDGPGETLGEQCFRLVDPISQRMMVLRADLTAGVARIAALHYGDAPRPLRLAYCGTVLRVRGSQIRPERQFTQAGVELIGKAGLAADYEAVHLALDSLGEIGLDQIGIDFALPGLLKPFISELQLDPAQEASCLEAIAARNPEAIGALVGGRSGEILLMMIEARGRWQKVRGRIIQLAALLPARAVLIESLVQLGDLVQQTCPHVQVTGDLAETQGFAYKDGIGFTLMHRPSARILGRGGRYSAGSKPSESKYTESKSTGSRSNGLKPTESRFSGESAVGFSLYLDTVGNLATQPDDSDRHILAVRTPVAVITSWRKKGYVVIDSLVRESPISDDEIEILAHQHGCTALLYESELTDLPR